MAVDFFAVHPALNSRSVRAGLAVAVGALFMCMAWLHSDASAADAAVVGEAKPTAPVDFTREIRPILASHCYACHGPDKKTREADLRLDTHEGATFTAIVPGKSDKSPLLERVSSKDPEQQMPPPRSKKPLLTEKEVALVKRWIDEGAKFEAHWAYQPPVVAPLPKVRNAEWAKSPIDRFIAAAQEQQGLSPAAEADRRTLIRRLNFDLLGLPPTLAEVEAFVNDQSPDAYEKLVDRLLASKHYGERMAIYWLDLVRFADTAGYHSDNHREISPYRDWVIEAFNSNMPFDKFTVEQLAGDMLPNATTPQRVASGYNRLLQTTEEGGAQPKEYTAKYQADRVRNVSSVWMGATMGCCECHDHKFDPYSIKNFYEMAAFFADVNETAVGRQSQTILLSPDKQKEVDAISKQLSAAQKVVETQTPELDAAQAKWEAEIAKDEKAKAALKLNKGQIDALAVPVEKRDAKQKQIVSTKFRSVAKQLSAAREEVARLTAQKTAVEKQGISTLVASSGNPRTVRILARGNWLDDSGEIVQPAVPEFLPPMKVEGKRATRLDLAKWLVSPEQPLTARVMVNRFWKLGFGQGLVRSLEDFGAQGGAPSHPQLLDWLAHDFIKSGWDVKRMMKQIVMSKTYRQSAYVPKAALEKDPQNHLFTRQNSYRLEAELVRDNALAVSGLLVPKIGGPSVKPYQPAGYWEYLNFPTRTYVADKGESQYRRGMYTYWQRTFIHPSLMAFDAPSREECTAERPRSNTPLQALVLLNDPTYVEAARVLAARVLREGGASPEAKVVFAMQTVLGRPPVAAEAKVLGELYAKHLAQYTADKAAAAELLKEGETPAPSDLPAEQLAAWTSVARVILNLHETITRP